MPWTAPKTLSPMPRKQRKKWRRRPFGGRNRNACGGETSLKSLASRRALIDRHVPGGAQLFLRIFTRLGCHGRPPQFVVEFHPYADLTHTIRLRQEIAYVRLSDILRDADLHVFESAAAILLSRM